MYCRSSGDLSGVMREIQRNASRRVTGRVNDLRLKRSPAKHIAFLQQLIDVGKLRRVDAEERRLHLHCLIERQVVAVHQHRSARVLMKFAQAADVIDVRVRADDGLYRELMTAEKVQDAIYFVAGVHHQRFARHRIADDRAIALQYPHGDGDMDQSFSRGIEDRSAVAHEGEYTIGDEGIRRRRSVSASDHLFSLCRILSTITSRRPLGTLSSLTLPATLIPAVSFFSPFLLSTLNRRSRPAPSISGTLSGLSTANLLLPSRP